MGRQEWPGHVDTTDLPAAQPTVDREALAEALRDAIHNTDLSRCGMASDTCPDWPLAHALADALLATSVLTDAARVRAEARRETAMVVDKVLTSFRPDQRNPLNDYGEGYRNGYDRATAIAREAARADTEETNRG